MTRFKKEPLVPTSSNDKCKLVPYSVIVKIKGSEKLYQDALEASSSFNKRLLKDRRMRIPFIDSQTRVAQANSSLWMMKYQRQQVDQNEELEKAKSNGYVYVYPMRKWYKHRRLNIEPNDSYLFPNAQMYKSYQQQIAIEFNSNTNNDMSNSMEMSHLHHHHHNNHGHSHSHHHGHGHHHNSHSSSNQSGHQMQNKQSSNDDHHDNELSQPAGGFNQQQQNHNLHLNHLHDDSLDNFDNNDHDDSDQDDYEESKKKKKRGKGKKKNEFAPNGDDKPFICDRCGVKYKTRPGLSYHIHKAHSNNSSSSVHHERHSSSSNHNSIKHSDIIDRDENTTNSVFESGYDDMNSSSSIPNLASNASNKCAYCIPGPEHEGKVGQQEKSVFCSECSRWFHPVCLKFSNSMVQSLKKYNWQCVDCKKCTHCGNSENDDKLLFCDDCDRGYHMYCLKPPLQEAPEGDWRCELCVKQLGSSS